MTEQEQKAFDLMREALEHIQRCIGFDKATIHQGSATWCEIDDALTAANAVTSECSKVTSEYSEQPQAPLGHDGKGCNEVLRMAGKAYPRTCKACGLGPCKWKSAANAVSHPQATEPAGCKRDPLDLGQYVNEEHISANDRPIAVIRKLQAVINERNAHHE